ncbi:MAG: TlpA disulfide reductase family protein [Rhodanobacter sp.]
MFSRSTSVILVTALLAAIVGGVVQHRHQAPADESTVASVVGTTLPALTLLDLEGHAHALDDYRGRRMLINFWASWCGPCLEEMPALNRAQEKFGDHGAIVLGIAMDDPDRVRAFLAEHPVSYPILLGQMAPPSTSLQLGDKGEILPFSVLIGADGRIIATHAGVLSHTQLEQWLAPALGSR